MVTLWDSSTIVLDAHDVFSYTEHPNPGALVDCNVLAPDINNLDQNFIVIIDPTEVSCH